MGRRDFSDFQRQIKNRTKELGMIHLQNPVGRAIRTKPRDQTELEILLRLSIRSKKRALESGKYEIIEPRRWRIHAGHSTQTES